MVFMKLEFKEESDFTKRTKKFEKEDLEDCIKHNLVIPFYQILNSNKEGLPNKYEALARIIYKDELVYPADFLDLAKEIKRYDEITKQISTQVFSFVFEHKIHTTLNLGKEDIVNQTTINFLLSEISSKKIGKYLTIEITEEEQLENLPTEIFEKFKQLGCLIALDDFGSGYSNFGNFIEYKYDIVKIDGSLIKNITKDERYRYALNSVLRILKALGSKTVAEFVSDKDIQYEVSAMGIDYSQGWYFGKASSIV